MYKLTNIVALVIASFAIIQLVCCRSSQPASQITGAVIYYSYPRQEAAGIEHLENDYKVFYQGDLIAYRYRFRFDSAIDYKVLASEYRHAYFVFHRDSAFGYSFSFNTPLKLGDRANRDSIVRSISIDKGNLDEFITKRPDSVYKAKSDGKYVELFRANQVGNSTIPAVEMIYSNDFDGIAESLSRKLDSAKGRKLTSVVVSTPPIFPYAIAKQDSLKARWGFGKLQPSDTIGISEVFRWYRNHGWLHTKQ